MTEVVFLDWILPTLFETIQVIICHIVHQLILEIMTLSEHVNCVHNIYCDHLAAVGCVNSIVQWCSFTLNFFLKKMVLKSMFATASSCNIRTSLFRRDGADPIVQRCERYTTPHPPAFGLHLFCTSSFVSLTACSFWSMAHRPKQSSLQTAKAARDSKAVLVGWRRLRFRLKFRAFQVRR